MIGLTNHVNGKNHQRALGFSMRVERAAVSSVKDKLKGLKRKKAGFGEEDFEEVVVADAREVKVSNIDKKYKGDGKEGGASKEAPQKKMKRETEAKWKMSPARMLR